MEKTVEKTKNLRRFKWLHRNRDMFESDWTVLEMIALRELIQQNKLDEAKGFILAKELSAGQNLFHMTWKR